MAEIFDKLKKGMEKSATVISVKSKEIIEATKVKDKIGTIKGHKRSAIEELGNTVYAMFNQGSFDEAKIRNKCEEIAALEKEIKEKEKELESIHQKAQEALKDYKPTALCDCGAAIYEGDKFCGKCGRKVEKKEKRTNNEL